MTYKIKNNYNENLDVLVEGKEDADTTVVFVHGFGTNKDEGLNIYKEIAENLKNNYRIVRFDFSGYGKSEGKQEDACYSKQCDELQEILNYVKQNFGGLIYLIAHSNGTFVTANLSPNGISKTVFTGLTNIPASRMLERLQARIVSRGGVFNEYGITIYPRTSGQVQKVGPKWWKEIREFDAVKAITEFNKKTKLILFKPMQDDVVGNEYFEDYKKMNLNYVELNGDHSFSKPEDRKILIEKIKEFFEE